MLNSCLHSFLKKCYQKHSKYILNKTTHLGAWINIYSSDLFLLQFLWFYSTIFSFDPGPKEYLVYDTDLLFKRAPT